MPNTDILKILVQSFSQQFPHLVSPSQQDFVLKQLVEIRKSNKVLLDQDLLSKYSKKITLISVSQDEYISLTDTSKILESMDRPTIHHTINTNHNFESIDPKEISSIIGNYVFS